MPGGTGRPLAYGGGQIHDRRFFICLTTLL